MKLGAEQGGLLTEVEASEAIFDKQLVAVEDATNPDTPGWFLAERRRPLLSSAPWQICWTWRHPPRRVD